MGTQPCVCLRVCRGLSLTQRVSAVDSVGVSSEGGLQDAAQLVSDYPVDIAEGDVFDVEQLTADLVRRVVLMHQDGVRQLVEVSQRQHGVVILDYHLTGRVKAKGLLASYFILALKT